MNGVPCVKKQGVNTMRYLLLLPLAMSVSIATHAQTLPEAMQSALDVHPEVQSAVHGRMAAEENMNAARGGYLPTIDLLAGYGRERTDSDSTRSRGNLKGRNHHKEGLTRGESRLRLQQMVFDGFATQSEVGRQRATVNARAYELLGTSESTALRVAEVYLDVLLRQELVRLAENNLRSHERIYDQITKRTRSGVGRTADLDQAEARLAQARNNLITEETNLSDAKLNYFSLVGQQPASLSMPTSRAVQLPTDLQTAREKMLQGNPYLSSAEADVQATEHQYKTAKSTFYPHFDVELSRSADNNLDGVPAHKNQWSAMVNMRYNLFAGGSNKADVRSKAYQINQAMDVRDNALRVLHEDMGLAWNALENANRQLPIAQQYVEHSSRVRESYQKQFTLGERTLLDLLDSENELFAASRRMEELRHHRLATEYRIQALTGELLRNQGVTAPLASVPMDEVSVKAKLPSL